MKSICNRFGAFLVVAGVMALNGGSAIAGDAGLIRSWASGGLGSQVGPCRQISVGEQHFGAIQENGTVVMQGAYQFPAAWTVPSDLGPCNGISVRGAFNTAFTLALKSNGNVVAWGYNTSGQLNVPSDLGACKQVAAGEGFAIALTLSGNFAGWGANTQGQYQLTGNGPFIQIAAGNTHSLAIKEDGTVVPSSHDSYGLSIIPANLGPCKGIAAGLDFSVALKTDGKVILWGNTAGITPPSDLGSCKQVAASDYGVGAIQENGSVRVWGYNGFGTNNVPLDLGPCLELSISIHQAAAIQVPPSSITGVLPISGPTTGGTAITISGTKFQNPPIVQIGGVLATDVVWVSSNTVRAVTPIGTPGMTTVSVNEISVEGFYYRPTCGSDLDNSGAVDSADLGIVLGDFGNCYESLTTPQEQEPFILQSVETPSPLLLNKK